MAVYTVNRCWKCPYSRKFGKKMGLLVPFGMNDDAKPSITKEDLVSTNNFQTTTIALPPTKRKRIHNPKAPGPRRLPRKIPDGLPEGLLTTLESQFGFSPSIEDIDHRFVRFSSSSKQCATAKRAHRHNHIYIIYDRQERSYQQLCYSQKCKHRETIWVHFE